MTGNFNMENKWIKVFEDGYPFYEECPFCKGIVHVNQDNNFLDYNYCPFCGENMRCNSK